MRREDCDKEAVRLKDLEILCEFVPGTLPEFYAKAG